MQPHSSKTSSQMLINPTEKYELYKPYKQSSTNILNEQLHYKTHTFFSTIAHARHTNICALPTTVNWKTNSIAVSSTGNVSFENGAHAPKGLC